MSVEMTMKSVGAGIRSKSWTERVPHFWGLQPDDTTQLLIVTWTRSVVARAEFLRVSVTRATSIRGCRAVTLARA